MTLHEDLHRAIKRTPNEEGDGGKHLRNWRLGAVQITQATGASTKAGRPDIGSLGLT